MYIVYDIVIVRGGKIGCDKGSMEDQPTMIIYICSRRTTVTTVVGERQGQ